MLKQRVASGIVLAAILLAAVIGLPERLFGFAAMILFVLAAWEWARLTSLAKPLYQVLYTILLLAILVVLWPQLNRPEVMWILGLVSVLWFLLLAGLAAYVSEPESKPRWQPLLAVAGIVMLSAAWLAFVKLHQLHFGWLLYLLVLCVTADSMAYLVGKMWGKNKLAPQLSPGKTREGLLGGLAGVFALSIIVVLFIQPSGFDAISLVLLSLITGLISVEGDLFESLIKREAGVKDSGKLLPGHGGILDRFDSHIAAAPVFYIGLNWVLG